MATLHQSDLTAWMRCPTAFRFERAGQPRKQSSALVYGSVMHHAFEVFERLRHTGSTFEEAVEAAVETFVHYWHPMNVEEICGAVEYWLPRQGYASLRQRGQRVIREYCELVRHDDKELLATEYGFQVPIDGTWDDDLEEPHILAGTVDRLGVGRYVGHEYLDVADYKGLALDTPLPTPTGWTTMGDVRVGDALFGADGVPCAVTGKSSVHHRPCYRIRFDDGSSIVADNVHLWQVHMPGGIKVLSTEDLRDNIFDPITGQRQLRIPNAKALKTPEIPLPLDPYVLGVWVGDGKHTSGEISKPDDELFDHLADRGFPAGQVTDVVGGTRTALGLRTQLRKMGLLGNKHIPVEYLRASEKQRLELLRGLMDTDGCWHRKRRRAVFTGCDERLARQVHDLVAGLGWRPSIFKVRRTGYGKTVTAWDVTFTPLDGVNPFRLSRKADLVDVRSTARAERRLVVSVDAVDSVPTQCIEVDSGDHLYLAGHQMVPTHNTGKEYRYLRQNLQFTAYCYASTKKEFWVGWRGEDGYGEDRGGELFERFSRAARRGTWIDLKKVAFSDAGWRGPEDYRRFGIACEQVVASMKADIYPLSISGETCQFCEFRDICTGNGVPDDKHGAPTR